MIIGALIGFLLGGLYFIYKDSLYRKDYNELHKLDLKDFKIYEFSAGVKALTNYLFLACAIVLVMSIIASVPYMIGLSIVLIMMGITEKRYSKYFMRFFYNDDACIICNKVIKFDDIDKAIYVKKLIVEQGAVYLKKGGGYFVYKQSIYIINRALKNKGRHIDNM